MIDLDVSQLAPDIATVLMLRGAQLPPVHWHENPHRAAKANLDKIPDDNRLFCRNSIARDDMAGAVRALLYLWNGWPDECQMYGQIAPEPESLYIAGLVERQAGHVDAAKTSFQELDGHTIYTPLGAYAEDQIGLGMDPAIKRFGEILKLNATWEPFAFIDLFEQARAGKLCSASEQTVCKLQCREFELLLTHCYEAAIGGKIPTRKVAASVKPRARNASKTRRRAGQSRLTQAASATATVPDIKIAVLCPKCQHKNIVSVLTRGDRTTCDKCAADFLVPKK